MPGRRLLSVGVAVALVAAGTVLAAGVASAATTVSQSTGQFLSGIALTQDLGNLAGIAPAKAVNTGAPPVVTVNKGLDATVLNAVNVNLGTVNLLGNQGILTLGTVNQYASASADGSSQAASGAVDQNGAVQIGTDGVGTPPANATLDLTKLLPGAGLTNVLSAGTVTIGALAGTANESPTGIKTGSYKIGSLTIDLTSPLVSNLTTTLKTALAPAQTLLNAVSALNLPGIVVVSGVPNLNTLITNLGTVTSADGSLTVNLNTGVVHLDLAKILIAAGLDINNLPPNTQLLPYITAALTSQLAPTITRILTGPTGLLNTITTAVDGITISTLGGPPVHLATGTLTPILNAVTAPLTNAVSNLGSTVVTPLANGLSTLVSLEANVQPSLPTASIFSVTALQIGVLPASGTAVVDLASASVGPNAGPVPAPTTIALNPNNGPIAGGTVVVITGTNFVPTATSVTIGSTVIPAASVTVNPAGTTATFTTPAHAAGPVPVTVTTPTGTSAPSLPFTYTTTTPPPGPPLTLSLDPNAGPSAGGTSVTITGNNFVAGSTVKIGTTVIPAGAVTLGGGGTTATFSTPAHAAGPVGVSVTNANGTSTPDLTYTYYDLPTAAGIDPAFGPAAGGTPVVITGNNFSSGVTSVTIGGITVPASAVTVNPSGTTASFTTPPHTAGLVGVTVTTPGGTTAPAQTFTYLAAPVTLSLNPTSGPSTGGQLVTITGGGFVPGATTVKIDTTVYTTAEVNVDPTGTTAIITTKPHVPGLVGVTVTTPGGTSAPALNYAYGAPVINPGGINPNHGPASGGTQVTLTGAGFLPGGTSITIGGILVPAANVTVNSTGTTAIFTTPPHAVGQVNVTATVGLLTSLPAFYTYDPPTTLSLSPGGGPLTGGTEVTITGSGFTPTSTVLIGGITVPATSVSLDGTTLTFITPARGAPGPVDVQVISSGVTTAPPLTYVYGPALALSLAPKEGPAAGGTVVVVTGAGFVPGGTSILIGGNTVPAANVAVDATGTTATFTTPSHPAGQVTVAVQTAGGISTPGLAYTYDPLAALSLTPDHGPSTGNTAVTITGSGFVPGQTSINIGGIVIPAGQVFVNPTGTTAVFLTPPHGDGGVMVFITTPAGTAGPLGYTYGTAAAPVASCVLTGVNPATGLNAATVSVVANTGARSSLVPSTFSVQVGGVTAGSEPVTPAVTGTVVASISVPVVNGTTAVDYRIAPQNAGAYPVFAGGPVTCTAITPVQKVAGIYFPLTPARLLDTRHGVGATQTLAPGATITLKVLGRGGVPATNVATVVLNMTVTEPVNAGYLTVYPGTSGRPGTSSINFAPKQTVANLVAAPVGSDGTVKIYNGSTGGTEAIADVAGYFSAGETVAPGSYVPVTPARLLDTSARVGVPTNTFVPSGVSVKLRVTGIGGVPATNVSAVSLNVTAAQPTTAGFITVYPSTSAKPFVSSLNFVKGATDANLVIAPVGTDGTVTLYNGSKGTVRLVADVSGFFRGGISVLNGEYVAISPSRILDTRSGVNVSGKVAAGASIAPTMVGRNGIPASGVSAVVFNLTVTSTTGPGFITAYPNNLPLASNLNFVAKQDQPNAVISPVGSGGKIRLYNGSKHPVDLVSDVFGYFIKR